VSLAAPATPAFADIRRDGNGGSSNLRRQSETLIGWKASRQAIDILDEQHRLLPHAEATERTIAWHA